MIPAMIHAMIDTLPHLTAPADLHLLITHISHETQPPQHQMSLHASSAELKQAMTRLAQAHAGHIDFHAFKIGEAHNIAQMVVNLCLIDKVKRPTASDGRHGRPIPPLVYFDATQNRFFHVTGAEPIGALFTQLWQARAAEFPSTAQAALTQLTSPSSPQAASSCQAPGTTAPTPAAAATAAAFSAPLAAALGPAVDVYASSEPGHGPMARRPLPPPAQQTQAKPAVAKKIPLPELIYYHPGKNAFYSATSDHMMGPAFQAYWQPRAHEFPNTQREAYQKQVPVMG